MASGQANSKQVEPGGWAAAPRLGPADLVVMLWRERMLAIMVAGVICMLGFAVAMLVPRTYTARAELLVRMGQEYVYQPGEGGGSVAPDMQSVLNAELRMLGSGVVVRRAINDVGLAQLYPEIAQSGDSAAKQLSEAERAFMAHLTLETAPETPSIALAFKHSNAVLSAKALNALVDAYLARRREVLVGGEYDALQRQSAAIDAQVQAANGALAAFLTANAIGDFDSELAGAAARLNDIDTQALDAATKQHEAEARRAALRARYEAEPAEIELFSESDARRALVQAQLEREQLLARYRDDAMPVREVDRRIAALQLFLQGGDTASLTRRGPNPVRQDLATQLFAADSEAQAQSGRAAALRQQRGEVETRLRQLQALQPDYARLIRERTILEQSATTFATRAEEARSFAQVLGRGDETISEVERAAPPAQGESLRLPIALATLALAALLGAAAALGRGIARKSFPTPESAARTLGAPLLAVTPRRRESPHLRVVEGKT